jgi:hypothetical protein
LAAGGASDRHQSDQCDSRVFHRRYLHNMYMAAPKAMIMTSAMSK